MLLNKQNNKKSTIYFSVFLSQKNFKEPSTIFCTLFFIAFVFSRAFFFKCNFQIFFQIFKSTKEGGEVF